MNSKQIMTMLVGLCFDLSKNKGVDAFFEYSPHVDCVTIRIVLNANYMENSERNVIYRNELALCESTLYEAGKIKECADDLLVIKEEFEAKVDEQIN